MSLDFDYDLVSENDLFQYILYYPCAKERSLSKNHVSILYICAYLIILRYLSRQ